MTSTPPPKKRGLGRGLDALIQKPAPPPAATEAVRTLPVTALRPNRQQPRTDFDSAELEALAASIRAQGVIQPLIVTPAAGGEGGTFTIVAGERRFRASQLAGLTEVPVVVRAVRDDEELLLLALVENLQRDDLGPLEEAEAYRRLQETFSLSQEAIAERVGKARATVTNALRLLRLPPEILDLLRSGRLTAGQARPLLAIEDPETQLRLARRATDEGLAAREIERLAAAAPGKRRAAQAPSRLDVHAAAAAERLTKRFQTKVEIRRRGKGGALHIHFHSEDELIRVYDLLVGKDGSDAP